MRSWLPFTLCLAACTHGAPAPPRTPATTAAAAAVAPKPRPRWYQGLYRLAFSHTQVSSCSRTFDVSTTEGTVALDLRRAGRARLTVERSGRSIGTARDTGQGYRHRHRPERCAWQGRLEPADLFGRRLRLTLERVEPAAFVCSWDGTAGGKKTARRVTLSCGPAARIARVGGPGKTGGMRRAKVLACALAGRLPRALEEITLDAAIVLSRRHRLRLSRTDDPSLGETQELHLLKGRR
jgi:hypothetical protein